jgi:ABC-type branched-subunit amino acid transport system substrate-binding protein
MSSGDTNHDGERRRTLLKVLGVGVASALAGCSGGGGDGDGGGDDETTAAGDGDETTAGDGEDTTTSAGDGGGDTLRVGVYGPLSGPVANIGEAKRSGWDLVTQLVNENGGIDGTEIELFYADSQSQPAQGRSAVNRLVEQENIDIIGGGYHSDVTLSVVEIANQSQLPQIIDESVSSAINDKIEEQNMRTVFKTAPGSAAYSKAWIDAISAFEEREVGYFPFENKRIAMIAEDTSYGITVMEDTASGLEEEGWTVTSQDEVPLDATDFTSVLSRIRSQNPDVVWAVQTSSAGTGALVDQFRDFEFGEAHFMHNFGLTAAQARERAGDAANGAFTVIHPAAVPSFLDDLGWTEAWNESHDSEISGPTATSMSNIWVIKTLVEDAGGVEAFREMGAEEWEQHVVEHDPIKAGIGNIDYQENHQAAWGSPDTIPSLCYQVVGGELNFVWPFEIAAAEIDESLY